MNVPEDILRAGAAALISRVSGETEASMKVMTVTLPLVAALVAARGLTVVSRGGRLSGLHNKRRPELQVLPVRGNIYVLVGAGANITLSVGREGVLLVDSGTASAGDNVIATVQRLVKEVTARRHP